jgi:rhodanese-related sulfurtransferase
MTATRIRPEEARRDLEAGEALLLCAYDDDAKFQQNRLDGAISLSEFRRRENSIPRDREIIFYCA